MNESFEHTVETMKDKWIMGDANCTVQCVNFFSTPNVVTQRVLGCGTKKYRGINFVPDPKLGLECFIDMDFTGEQSQGDAKNQKMSCHGPIL